MMNPFTQRSKRVLNYAANEAARLQSSQIGTEHLLAGLVLEGDGVAAKILKDLGFDGRAFLDSLGTQGAAAPEKPEYSPRAKRVWNWPAGPAWPSRSTISPPNIC